MAANSTQMTVVTKRAYDAPAKSDGYRVLVDRLWPRGLSKEVSAIDLWLKDVAPSAALRTWFNHQSERWPHFIRRYRLELQSDPLACDAFAHLQKLVQEKSVTLIYAARDEEHNNAVALKQFLGERTA
ncbi:MAG: DUF488 family protein [Pseudomonadota bacterium]